MVGRFGFVVAAGLGVALGCGRRGAEAATFTLNSKTYTTQFNTGSGADHALMVLQYGASSYAFGYAWDPSAGAKDGHDMLLAITAASGGTMVPHITFSDFGDGPEPFVQTIDYLTNVPAPYAFPFPFDSTTPGFSWTAYFSADGGSDWSASQTGDVLRPLADGSADDWVYQNVPPDENFNPLVLPAFAIATPEAGSLGMLAIGLMSLARRRRI